MRCKSCGGKVDPAVSLLISFEGEWVCPACRKMLHLALLNGNNGDFWFQFGRLSARMW